MYMVKIDLLTAKEYSKYKSKIPSVNCEWWLRSPGYYSNFAAYVDHRGFANLYGDLVHDGDHRGVRPALYVDKDIFENIPNQRIIYGSFPWTIIDSNLAIAEVPINFTYFDEELNYYETSHIKQFIEQWLEERNKEYES